MLFRQRKKPTWLEKIRLYMWPRRSFIRSIRYYIKRLLRIPAKPHLIALGLAIGVFFAVTPLYGFHILLAIFFAWILSANIAAAALGTVLANPLTMPLFFSATYEMGRLILPITHKALPMPVLWEQLQQFNFNGLTGALLQITAGVVFLGVILASIAYICAFLSIKRFQEERQKKLLKCYLQYHGYDYDKNDTILDNSILNKSFKKPTKHVSKTNKIWHKIKNFRKTSSGNFIS